MRRAAHARIEINPPKTHATPITHSIAPTAARAIAAAPSPSSPSSTSTSAVSGIARPLLSSSRRSVLTRADAESSTSSSVGSDSTVVSTEEIAAANAAGEGTGGGGGGSAEAAVWAATADSKDPRVRFYVSMTLRHRWPVTWSDIIIDRIAKGGYEVSQQKLDNMVAFLTTAGISDQDVCYMAAVAPGMLSRSAKRHGLPLYNYLKQRVKGKGARAAVLREYPRLLEYDVVGEGDSAVLVRGNARASVDVVKGNVGVSFWRDGAVFDSAPVSPMVPTPERKR